MARTAIQNANASLYMDGSAGYFTIPITPSPTGFSFGLWIKTGKRTAASTSIFASSNSAAFTDGFYLGRGNGRGDIEFIGYNTTNPVNPPLRTGNVSDSVWAHVAVTYLPSGSCSIYLNGALASTVTATNTISTGTATIYVGRRSYAATFAGLNANNLVWHNTTTPWTAQQVSDLYNGTVPTGATAVYPLSEGAGSIAYDTSGNGNDGTITSGTWTRDTPTKTRKAVGGNMVFNGDFEIAPVVNVPTTTQYRWIDGTASGNSVPTIIFGWGLESLTGTGGAQFDTSVKYSGNASMKLSTSAVSSTVEVSQKANSSFINSTIPVLPSTSYTATCRIKTNITSGTATTGAQLRAIELQGNNSSTAATNTIASGIVTTQDWTQYTATFTTASNTRFIKMVCRLINDGAATLIGDAYFDDITLTLTTPETRTAAGARLPAVGRIAV